MLNVWKQYFSKKYSSWQSACKNSTHVGIVAHPDDLEILAYHGIEECFQSKNKRFSGLVCTQGELAPVTGIYKKMGKDALARLRWQEQCRAARIGQYEAVLSLGYKEKNFNTKIFELLVTEIKDFLEHSSAKIVYTHSPVDRHPHHVLIALATVHAVSRLPKNKRPKNIYGCEVWGSLDWLPSGEKIFLGVDRYPNLAKKILGVYHSQIIGTKKNYVLATLGRRTANAVYNEPKEVGKFQSAVIAISLNKFVGRDLNSIKKYFHKQIKIFSQELSSGFEF